MSAQAQQLAAHERLLYAYVFDARVDEHFRAYDETTRRERFRAIYARAFNHSFARIYPLFLRMRGPITVDEIVELRAELREGARLPEDADDYLEMGQRLCQGHPKATMLRELLRVERAKLLASRGPTPRFEQLFAEAQTLDEQTLREAGEAGRWDGELLHYVELRTSLKESLVSLRRDVGLPNWTVRTPRARASVIYRSPRTGAVEHWCFRDREGLLADLHRRASR